MVSYVEQALTRGESVLHLGRMLDFGTIVIAGGGTPQAPVPGIRDPMGFRRDFLEAQEIALKDRPSPAAAQ